MSSGVLLPLLGAFAAGVLLGWLVAVLLGNRAAQRRQLASAERLSSAEATAAGERQRRVEIERELERTENALRDLDRQQAVSREREERAREHLEELRRFAESSKRELEDSFKALAATALKGSSEQFLSLAEQKLATDRTRAAADLDERRQAITALLDPLQQTLEKLDRTTQEVERSRVEAYSRLDQQVGMLSRAAGELGEKTHSLATALQGSQVRGRWGELALRNVAELAGMTEHCDFEEQMTLEDGKRPDMIVHLPGRRLIAIDAKAPLTAYLEATEARDETARQAALDRHVRALRGHIRTLAGRDYADLVPGDVDLVVMFLPGDPFLAAAFAKDPDLHVEALRSKVLVATPTTLVALLRTVAVYWQQRSLAENAEAIAAAARELYQRAAKFGDELAGVGRGLKSALDAYNRAVGSFDRRLLPMGRRLEEMKISEQTKRDLLAPEPIDDVPRVPEG